MIPRLLARRLMAAKIVALCFLFSSASAADITQSQAETALAAALEKAEIQGTLMNVAIVDVGANLKAFVHLSGQHRCRHQEGQDCTIFQHGDRQSEQDHPARRRHLQHRAYQRRTRDLPRRSALEEQER